MTRQRRVVRHRRCNTRTGPYTSGSGYAPPLCPMCGKPVVAGQASSMFFAPGDPAANRYGIVVRHAQAASGTDTLFFRFDRKWGREHA